MPLAILQHLKLAPHGVLGKQRIPGRTVPAAEEPGASTVFCDPAGLSFIKNGPYGAGGASGDIYRFLGIDDDDAFPEPVRNAVTAEGLAKYHKYAQDGGGALHCIHVVGPDFRGRDGGFKLEDAQQELAAAYKNVLCEFLAAASVEGGPTELRLLPISAGRFKDKIAKLTMDALGAAEALLPQEVIDLLESGGVEVTLCIFMQDQLAAFQEAHRILMPPESEEEDLDDSQVPAGSEMCDSDVKTFNILLLGTSGVGKSSLINRFIEQEPLFRDGSVNPDAAATACVGSGAGGTTLTARSLSACSRETDHRVIEITDMIGIGTTRKGEDGATEGGLLIDLEEMQKMGKKFHVILFCVNACDPTALNALGATVKAVMQYSFLEGKNVMKGKNVILVAGRADECRFFEKNNFRYPRFESDIVPAFFTEDCFGDGAAELRENFAYTYYESEEEKPPCKAINIHGLLAKIKATPNWIRWLADELDDADLFDPQLDDDKIDKMFEPLMTGSGLGKEEKERAAEIKENLRRLRDERDRIQAERDKAAADLAAVRDDKDKLADKYGEAIKMRADLDRSNNRNAIRKKLKEDFGISLESRAWANALRLHTGNLGGPRKADWLDFYIEHKFPNIGWLAYAAAFRGEIGDAPPAPHSADGASSSAGKRGKRGKRGKGTTSHRACPQCGKLNPMRTRTCECGNTLRTPVVPLLTMRSEVDAVADEEGEHTWWQEASDNVPRADLAGFGKEVSEALAGGEDVFAARSDGWTVLHEAIWRKSLSAVEAICKHAGSRLGELLQKEGGSNKDTAWTLIAGGTTLISKHLRKCLSEVPKPGAASTSDQAGDGLTPGTCRPRRSVTPGSAASASEEGGEDAPPTAKKRKGNEGAAVPVQVLKKRVKGQGHQYRCTLEGGGEAWLPGLLLRESYSELLAAFDPAAAAAAAGDGEAAAAEEEAAAAADPFAFP